MKNSDCMLDARRDNLSRWQRKLQQQELEYEYK